MLNEDCSWFLIHSWSQLLLTRKVLWSIEWIIKSVISLDQSQYLICSSPNHEDLSLQKCSSKQTPNWIWRKQKMNFRGLLLLFTYNRRRIKKEIHLFWWIEELLMMVFFCVFWLFVDTEEDSLLDDHKCCEEKGIAIEEKVVKRGMKNDVKTTIKNDVKTTKKDPPKPTTNILTLSSSSENHDYFSLFESSDSDAPSPSTTTTKSRLFHDHSEDELDRPGLHPSERAETKRKWTEEETPSEKTNNPLSRKKQKMVTSSDSKNHSPPSKCILQFSLLYSIGTDKNSDICYFCHDGGELLICESDTCSNSFHLQCLGLKRMPKKKWICPFCRYFFWMNEWMRLSGRPRRYSQFIREHMLKDWYLSAIHMDKQRPFLLLEGIFF